jgi:neurotransmitter:Na+ symporter, NSS family
MARQTLVRGRTRAVVARGVRSGLEKAVRILMPLLFAILVILVGYAMNTGHFEQGLRFLFRPDFSKLSADGVLIAMGHAFFTLSLGMGAIMVYGSYLPEKASIAGTTFTIALLDTLVAILAAVAIFPIVFANGLEPGAGPGLIFQTMPIAFGQMPGGILFGTLFFVLLVFAAWTSAISLIEPAVAWLVENHGYRRLTAAILVGVLSWCLGLLTVFSFNLLENFMPLGFLAGFQDKTFFGLFDYLTANIMLPLGGLLIAIFAGWVLQREASVDELRLGDGLLYRGWYYLIRYLTPLAVGLVFLDVTGLLDIGGLLGFLF